MGSLPRCSATSAFSFFSGVLKHIGFATPMDKPPQPTPTFHAVGVGADDSRTTLCSVFTREAAEIAIRLLVPDGKYKRLEIVEGERPAD